MKKVFINILVIALITSSCNNREPTEPDYDPDAVRVAGKYNALKFIIPGDNDIPINVLEIGGKLEIELIKDFGVKGFWAIPEHPNYRGGGFEETFQGTFLIKNDSLQFVGTQNIFSNPQFFFIVNQDTLELKMEESVSPTIITLIRN